MEHMQARHLLKQYHRARLGHIGLGFCDENATRLQKLEQQYADARGSWETESTLYRPVIVAAWHASTTDNELQTIGTRHADLSPFSDVAGLQLPVLGEMTCTGYIMTGHIVFLEGQATSGFILHVMLPPAGGCCRVCCRTRPAVAMGSLAEPSPCSDHGMHDILPLVA